MRGLLGRRRLSTVLLTGALVLCITAAAVVGTGSAVPALALSPAGHWVFNAETGSALHVDAGTRQVDAKVDAPDAASGGPVLMALQSPTHGYLVAPGKVSVFGKSTLTVDTTYAVEAGAAPVGIETVGGPYLVYERPGNVVRLDLAPITIPAGGPLGAPTYTDAGVVWVHRTDRHRRHLPHRAGLRPHPVRRAGTCRRERSAHGCRRARGVHQPER